MEKGRLEAFSDGVLAIIITIMVLELKVPHGEGLEALQKLTPVFLSYVLSFIYIGIYWNNHHHMLYSARSVSGAILWANLHMLFWLSTVPFVTGWMGENHFAMWPVACYGFVLLMSAISFTILSRSIIQHDGADSVLAQAVGKDYKGNVSLVCYVLGISLAFVNPWMALAMYAVVAVIWFLPDPRIEKQVESNSSQ